MLVPRTRLSRVDLLAASLLFFHTPAHDSPIAHAESQVRQEVKEAWVRQEQRSIVGRRWYFKSEGNFEVKAMNAEYLVHSYRQVRNRKVNQALIQGVETARAILTTTTQGQAADVQFVKWLMEHQKEAGVFTAVSGLVEQFCDNPAARLSAQEIAERVQRAQQQTDPCVGTVIPSAVTS